MDKKRKLFLATGQSFTGTAFGSEEGDVISELVFNTSMAGYQEIISDPSYTDQAVVMTYPLIGNYGISDEDYESKSPSIGALVVREYNDDPSSWRSDETLDSVMKRYGIAGISGVDTRKLTRIIREIGSCKALLTDSVNDSSKAFENMKNTELRRDQVSRVTAGNVFTTDAIGGEEKHHVVAIDCGMKLNIVRELNAHGCKVTVIPYDTPVDKIEALKG